MPGLGWSALVAIAPSEPVWSRRQDTMRPDRRDDTLGVMHTHLVASELSAASIRVLLHLDDETPADYLTGVPATGADLEVGDEVVRGDVAFALLPVGSEA
jgi:hypothetical protein